MKRPISVVIHATSPVRAIAATDVPNQVEIDRNEIGIMLAEVGRGGLQVVGRQGNLGSFDRDDPRPRRGVSHVGSDFAAKRNARSPLAQE
jgi:hypothetical protein